MQVRNWEGNVSHSCRLSSCVKKGKVMSGAQGSCQWNLGRVNALNLTCKYICDSNSRLLLNPMSLRSIVTMPIVVSQIAYLHVSHPNFQETIWTAWFFL